MEPDRCGRGRVAKETAREGSEHPQVRGAKEEGARVYASESTQAQALRPKSRPPGAAAEGPLQLAGGFFAAEPPGKPVLCLY